jgi:hypothetical protein
MIKHRLSSLMRWYICLFILCLVVMEGCREKSFPAPLYLPNEAGSEFLVRGDSVYYTLNTGSGMELHQILGNSDRKLFGENNCLHPFLYRGKLAYLKDSLGNESFLSSNKQFNQLLGGHHIRKLNSFNEGRILVVQINESGVIYIVIPSLNKLIRIKNIYRYAGVAYDEPRQLLIVAEDLGFTVVNCQSFSQVHYDSGGIENARDLFVAGHFLYFSANDKTDYRSIYKLNLLSPQGGIILVKSSSHDLRLPKLNEGRLYYVEVVNHEYLLKRVDSSGSTDIINKHGVIYNYDFVNNRLVYAYAGLNNPRSIYLTLTIHPGQSENCFPKAVLLPKIIADEMNYSKSSHPFLILKKNPREAPKGIIVFLHPGQNTDFSPRWDLLLNNLCLKGYWIAAPNLPSSSGNGIAYEQGSDVEALAELKQLNKYLFHQYNDVPLYYLCSSFSNILQEAMLSENNAPVSAAASLFGIPATSSNLSEIHYPVLYILGENDPYVSFKNRVRDFPIQLFAPSISYLSYPAEGHWFRSNDHMSSALDHISTFFKDHTARVSLHNSNK